MLNHEISFATLNWLVITCPIFKRQSQVQYKSSIQANLSIWIKWPCNAMNKCPTSFLIQSFILTGRCFRRVEMKLTIIKKTFLNSWMKWKSTSSIKSTRVLINSYQSFWISTKWMKGFIVIFIKFNDSDK
jgi:hypothetical protein